VSEREVIKKVLKRVIDASEEDLDKYIDIVMKNPKRKIVVALNQVMHYLVDKYGKVRKKMTIEEFERILKKVRF